jgi:thiamine kinase-like enzyme
MQEVFDNMAEGEEVRINLDLNINWQGDIKTAAEAAEGMLVGGQRVKIVTEAAVEEADSPEDRQKKQMQRDLWQRTEIEIEDLLCRLYHRASSIQIRTLTGGYSGALVLHVKPLFDGIMGRPQVTKIGHLAAITREYKNHRDYVQDYLARVPNAVDYMRTAQLAGINYTFVEGPGGEDLNDFETFYEEHSFDAIKALLDDLFNTVCINWYNGRQLEECRLSESYRHDLKLRKGKLEEALKHLKRRIQTGQDTIVVPEIDESHHFVNPIPVAMNRDIMLFAFRSMTHGDLNARNILVDNNDHAWLIDFSHTEIGHMLRDIAKLDSVLRIQMLSQQEATLQERFYLEETLADAASPNQIMQLSDQLETDNPALQKVYRTVRYLRQYAATISNGSASMEDYDVALMYNNISAITYYSLSKLQRLHGLLSASLLARRVRDR